jgi:hypothetical protein
MKLAIAAALLAVYLLPGAHAFGQQTPAQASDTLPPARSTQSDHRDDSPQGERFQRALAQAQREIGEAQREAVIAQRELQRSLAETQREVQRSIYEAQREARLGVQQAQREIVMAERQATLASRQGHLAREQVATYREMMDEMVKDHLIERGKDSQIEYRDGNLLINGKEQPSQVRDKYKHYFNEKNQSLRLNLGEGIAI